MDETCRAPDGSEMWTFGMNQKAWTLLRLLLVASTPLAIMLLGPKLLFKVGRMLGYYLRKKTAGRKAQILELVDADEREFKEEGGEQRDSDEWENVEAYAVGSSKNGEKADKEWDGIVGFFHPFW